MSDKLQRRLQWAKNAKDVIGLILSNEHTFYDGSLKELLVSLGLIDSSGTYVITVKGRWARYFFTSLLFITIPLIYIVDLWFSG